MLEIETLMKAPRLFGSRGKRSSRTLLGALVLAVVAARQVAAAEVNLYFMAGGADNSNAVGHRASRGTSTGHVRR